MVGQNRGSDKTMKVLIVIDAFGWAFDFVARGIQKYSKHEVEIERFSNIGEFDCDCVFFMNRSCLTGLSHPIRRLAYQVKNKCVGIRGGLPLMSCDYPILGWKIACVQRNAYEFLRAKHPNERIFLCRNAVDTEIFTPIKRNLDEFFVGWAGNPNQPVKRYYLLDYIKFPLKRQINWGSQHFIVGRPRTEMTDFYKSINTLINVSSQEGFSQCLLEASATKLPIVCTDVGGHGEFMDKEWLVTPTPDKKVIMETNKKLSLLKEDSKLRLKIGQENFDRLLKEGWTWKQRVKEYDELFES